MKKLNKRNILPNPFLYYLILPFWRFINKFKINNHYVINELKNKKGPFVVVANHVSSNDQIITACATNQRMNYIVAESTYYSKLNKLIKIVNAIPKQQFFTHLTDLRKIDDVLINNGIIAIFPTGLCSADGASTTLPKGTGKFIKRLNVDVYAIVSQGMYLSNPKWSKVFRKGRVDTKCIKLFSKDELKDISPEKVYDKLNDVLTFNEYEWQKKNLRFFKHGDNSKGLENVLYSCPICKTKFSIENINNSLVCNHCHNVSKLDKYGLIINEQAPEIDNPVVWHEKLINLIKDEISNNDLFSYSSEVKFSILNKDKCKFENEQKGLVKVNKEFISIIDSKENVIYKINVINFFSLPNIPGEYFDLQNGITIYRCYPTNAKDVSYITDIIIALYELRESRS